MRAAVLLIAAAASLALAAPAHALPKWLAPVEVVNGGGTNVEGAVAVAPNGTTLVVSDLIGDQELIRARLRRPGEAFGQVFDLSPPGVGASNPSVAVDQQGNFTVTWLEDPNSQVRAARLPAGAGAFVDFQTVSSGNPAFTPVVAVGGNGAAVIAYRQTNAIQAAIRLGAAGQFLGATTVSPLNPEAYEAAVDDAGNAILVWSRDLGDRELVEASERPAGAGFPPPAMARKISADALNDINTDPAVAMAPDGRVLVLWSHRIGTGSSSVLYAERTGTWSAPLPASKPAEPARLPDVTIAANGSAVASWIADVGSVDVLQGAVRAPGGSFGDYRNFPSTTVGVPEVEGNRAGDAFVAWNGFMGEGVFAVRRPAGGDFGSVDTVALGTQGVAMPAIALFLQNFGLDDQGNATALTQLSTNPGGTFVYRLEAASYDAAPPSLDAVSVPAGGTPGAAIGMAATASDRLSTPSISWSFGDGATASGPAVSHAYGAAGAYSVTVTATDGAGNSTSASRSVVITQAGGPPPPPRIESPVLVLWGVDKRKIYLLRMKVTKVPPGAKAQLRCKGRKCPFKRKSSKRVRKGAITLFKEIKPRNVVGKRQRTFRAGQRLQLRITAPGFVGKVVKYRLRKGRIPSGRTFCLPPGATKPAKC